MTNQSDAAFNMLQKQLKELDQIFFPEEQVSATGPTAQV